jgi:hypothetical protein
VLEGEYVADDTFPLPITLPDLLPEEDSGPRPIPLIPITSRKEGASSSRTRPGSGGSRGARGQEATTMDIQEAIEMIVNAPEVTVSKELMEVINDPAMMMTRNGEITRRIGSRQFERQNILPSKKKRKISKYQKEFGKQLKLLKKKFPRTAVTKLMKRAHTATRKALGMKRGTRKGQVRKTARRAFKK